MRKSTMSNFTDIGDSFCEGDPLPEDIDWSKVEYLQERYNEVHSMPEGEEKSLAMVVLLHEMHGDELEVL
jgi:hypothetical protein